MAGKCMNCGAANAPFGFRRRGQLSRLPDKHRSYVWVCGAPACIARAEAWKDKADGAGMIHRPAAPTADPPAKAKAKTPDPKSSPAQGDLF